MSTVQNVRNITRNGLVLLLNRCRYQIICKCGSTLWNDLSLLQNNTTLVNGPTHTSSYLGGIVFDEQMIMGQLQQLADRLRWANSWTGTSPIR